MFAISFKRVWVLDVLWVYGLYGCLSLNNRFSCVAGGGFLCVAGGGFLSLCTTSERVQ